MKLTEEAVYRAINYTETAQQDLLSNLEYMKSSTTAHLVEWHDTHVERFLEQLELFDSYVRNTVQNMEKVKDHLNQILNFMRTYNNM
jgi:hypothetical protein